MLSSSDAKFRCLWHMVVWSILLIFVSQFLVLTDHIAFYIFAAFCILVLPVVTSIYSTTSGRHGAGLLRVIYVLCDPVLASVTVLPPLLFNHLPHLIDDYTCLSLPTVNDSLSCMFNVSSPTSMEKDRAWTSRGVVSALGLGEFGADDMTDEFRQKLLHDRHNQLVIVQISLMFPAILTLLMGRRTRKMDLTTYLLIVAYWIIVSVELAELVEVAMLNHNYIHYIYTTEAIASIAIILINSYSVVTLCSYISPMGTDAKDDRASMKRFDFIYKCLVGIISVVFVEVPLLVARCQIFTVSSPYSSPPPFYSASPGERFPSLLFYHPLPATFRTWLVKDILFIGLVIALVAAQRIMPWRKMQVIAVPCARVTFDDPHVFEPEKRDVYIGRRRFRSGEAAGLEAGRVAVRENNTSGGGLSSGKTGDVLVSIKTSASRASLSREISIESGKHDSATAAPLKPCLSREVSRDGGKTVSANPSLSREVSRERAATTKVSFSQEVGCNSPAVASAAKKPSFLREVSRDSSSSVKQPMPQGNVERTTAVKSSLPREVGLDINLSHNPVSLREGICNNATVPAKKSFLTETSHDGGAETVVKPFRQELGHDVGANAAEPSVSQQDSCTGACPITCNLYGEASCENDSVTAVQPKMLVELGQVSAENTKQDVTSRRLPFLREVSHGSAHIDADESEEFHELDVQLGASMGSFVAASGPDLPRDTCTRAIKNDDGISKAANICDVLVTVSAESDLVDVASTTLASTGGNENLGIFHLTTLQPRPTAMQIDAITSTDKNAQRTVLSASVAPAVINPSLQDHDRTICALSSDCVLALNSKNKCPTGAASSNCDTNLTEIAARQSVRGAADDRDSYRMEALSAIDKCTDEKSSDYVLRNQEFSAIDSREADDQNGDFDAKGFGDKRDKRGSKKVTFSLSEEKNKAEGDGENVGREKHRDRTVGRDDEQWEVEGDDGVG